jgi:hypothetical protein
VAIPSPDVPVTAFEVEGVGEGTSTFEDFDTMTREQTIMDLKMDKRGSQGRGRDGLTGDDDSQQSLVGEVR